MENEQIDKINIYTENESDLVNGFKMDYRNQILNNNVEFINWKNSMLKKYGNDAKMFKCSKDNLLFFTSKNNCKKIPMDIIAQHVKEKSAIFVQDLVII